MSDNEAPEATAKQLRQFGLLVGSILIIIGSYWMFYRDIFETARMVVLVIGGILFISGLAIPTVLKPIYKVWMALAHVLAWVNTRIIISLIFFLVITPIGFLLRIFKGDFLGEKFHSEDETYWSDTERAESVKEHCERQF